MEQALASISHLTLRYGSVTAVNNVSFALYPGEILALVGPNGSGKTSSVECLEGLRKPSGGSVSLLGLEPSGHRREVFRKVGVQLQNTGYPDKIKVKELCRLFSSFYDDPADWRSLLAQFDLEKKAGRTVNRLSGGERQRLSVLLALLPRPKLLILDELTTGLDPEIRRGMWENLLQIKKAGTGVLLVSHYMDEVEALADRLVYLSGGNCLFSGTQQQFRDFALGKMPDRERENLLKKGHLSLEDLYLSLSSKTSALHLDGIF